MASREYKAWAGDRSCMKSSVKVVRQRHCWGSSSLLVGATVGTAAAPGEVISGKLVSSWFQVFVGPPALFTSSLCTVEWTDKSRLALTQLPAVSPDY